MALERFGQCCSRTRRSVIAYLSRSLILGDETVLVSRSKAKEEVATPSPRRLSRSRRSKISQQHIVVHKHSTATVSRTMYQRSTKEVPKSTLSTLSDGRNVDEAKRLD